MLFDLTQMTCKTFEEYWKIVLNYLFTNLTQDLFSLTDGNFVLNLM